jgi:putative ABC transport system permease protein
MLESLLLATAALAVALIITFIFLPMLNMLINRQLTLEVLTGDPVGWVSLIGLTLLLGLLTGVYPSLYMTSVNAARVLKGAVSGSGKSVFQRSLVVLQFSLAMGMMVGTAVVMQQLFFMRNKDVGFTTDHMVLIELDREANQKYDVLKTEMSRLDHVLGITASGQRLGNNLHQWGYKVKGDTGVFNLAPSNIHVDPDYLTVYGMELKEGRNFIKGNPLDEGKSFIVNEAMVKSLGLKQPVGTQVGLGYFHDDSLGSIIGVVKDFNFNSLHHSVNTLSIVHMKGWGYEEMTVKIDGKDVPRTLEELGKVWVTHVSNFPFTHTFLDTHMNELYRTEQQMSSVITIMAGLAILISCMGLFGLAMITTERRIKEVGIRKALGASAFQITLLMSGQFGKLILIAFVLITPIAWMMLNNWLSTFAFRVTLNPLIFLVGGLLALAIGMLTISYHTLRSARANPVKALRYE